MKKKIYFQNERGFSLVQVMVAGSLLAVVSVFFMQLTKNMGTASNTFESKVDELELQRSIRMILDDPKHCRLSLAGNGTEGNPTTPETFFKIDVDEVDNALEGKDVELYWGNTSADARGRKKYSASDDDYKNFGRVKIKSLKLYMNNGLGVNYSPNVTISDAGIIRVIIEKKTNKNETRDVIFDFDINLNLATSATGEATIISCRSGSSLEIEEMQNFSLTIPRNSSRMRVEGGYKLCMLSQVRGGGNDGGDRDFCGVHRVGADWVLSGQRGDDPAITCKMICIN